LPHLRLLNLDYGHTPSRDHARALADCRNVLKSGDAANAEQLWKRLLGIADENRPGGSIDLPKLLGMLRAAMADDPDLAPNAEQLARALYYGSAALAVRSENTAQMEAEVGAFALLFTIGLGMLLGVVAAVRQNTWVDYVLSTTSVIGYRMPNFVIATFLLLFFAVWLDNTTNGSFYFQIGWSGTYGSIGEIWLPAFALGFPYASIVARLTRASMLEVIRQDYIRTARAKGLRETVIMVRHALRNALIPVITILGPLVIGIITGGVIIENIFGIPGLGKEFATSILNRDYNIVIGVFTMYAAMVGLANLLVVMLYVVIDPRIRY